MTGNATEQDTHQFESEGDFLKQEQVAPYLLLMQLVHTEADEHETQIEVQTFSYKIKYNTLTIIIYVIIVISGSAKTLSS